jgi:CheY-like chemotaxis protein
VVDDEPEIHSLIKHYLAGIPVTVVSAYTGEQGVQVYREMVLRGRKPDIVVMDLNLSGTVSKEDMLRQMRGEEMDGVATTREILKIDKAAQVIGFTAYASLEWGERLRQTGALEVYGRGIGFEGFAQKICELLA